MDWNDLRFFLAVARLGGLTPAAAELSVSASTVFRHIDSLEAALGVRLFARHQRGYLLTDEGALLLERTADVEQALLSLEDRGATGASLEGTVRVAADAMLAQFLLAPALAGFQSEFPRLRVDLKAALDPAASSASCADLVVHLGEPRLRMQESHGFVGAHLGDLGHALYCSNHLLDLHHGDWHDLPFIGGEQGLVEHPAAEWLRSVFPGRQPVLRTDSFGVQYAAVLGGLGAAILPRFLGDREQALASMPLKEVDSRLDVWVATPRSLGGSRRIAVVQQFIEDIVKRVRG